MLDLEAQVLAAISRKNYQPVKPKALERTLHVPNARYAEFPKVLKTLLTRGLIELGKHHSIRSAPVHGGASGVSRRAEAGYGFVRPPIVDGHAQPEIFIPEGQTLDAATGDTVL